MIPELVNARFVRNAVERLEQIAGDFMPELIRTEATDEATAMITRRMLQRLRRDETLWADDSLFWMPHDADAALVQGSLEEYYERNEWVRETEDDWGEELVMPPEAALMWQVGVPLLNLTATPMTAHPKWVLALLAMAKKQQRGIAPFPDNRKHLFQMSETARMVLFGDWGSGLKPAQKLAKEVWDHHCLPELNQKREVHVVHLGDVYFAGLERDYRKRFLRYWPVPGHYHYLHGNVYSWCLTGNHDMYSGGHEYFKMLKDARFQEQKQASYFRIENSSWQIFGLDTSFDPIDLRGENGDLYGEQAGWLAQVRDEKKKCVLLTHHQPFSGYRSTPERLERQLRPILTGDNTTAWFWGHEHLCAQYHKHANINFPILLGHGGFPQVPKSMSAGLPSASFEWTDTMKWNHLWTILKFGFAVLDFDKDRIHVHFFDLDGKQQGSYWMIK